MTGARPLKILQLSDFYAPTLGGLERHVQSLSHELKRRGHEVRVGTLAQHGIEGERDDAGVLVHRLDGWYRRLQRSVESPSHLFHPIAPDPGVMRSLSALMDEFDPDVVSVHSWIMYSYLAIADRYRAKVIASLHDYGAVCPKKTYVRGDGVCGGPGAARCVPCAATQYGAAKGAVHATSLRASSRLHARVDRWVAVSRSVADASARATGGRPVAVIPSFVPDAALDEARAPVPPELASMAGRYLIFVGALGRHKGLHTLLAAYERLEQRLPLVLMGTPRGDTPSALPPGVRLETNVPHARVMAALAGAAVAAVPSEWPEPFGQTAVEAMLCSRPVVAGDVGALREVVIDGRNGLRVPPRDAASLARAIDSLLSDPGLADRLGRNGREDAKQYLCSAVVPRIETLYYDTLDRARAAA
jgi:glycosyltransferase involved in cell wall biosynthesis